MTNERKYRDEEVKEIFDLAARRDETGPSTLSDGGGLTLAELQEVGLEVGMEPRRIVEAALALDARRELLPRRSSLGMPISVGRIIELPRAVTDREWDVLVGELRETFRARGRVASHGGVREWSNGNLHAFLEPTETGHRLRMGTVKGSAKVLNGVGATGLAIGLILLTVAFLTGDLQSLRGIISLFPPLVAAGMGGGALAYNVFSLPRWAREREGQMEYIAGRVHTLIGEGSEEEGPGS